MSHEKPGAQDNLRANEHPGANGAADPDAAPAAGPVAEAVSPEEMPIVDFAAVLEAEKAELKDRLLRVMADMENLRRRTEREVADARAYGVTALARDMLSTADNLRRAVESVPPEARASGDANLKALIDGVELTERDLLKSLERHKVKPIEPLGLKFDPNMHQAIFEAPDAAHAKGFVMTVVQSGYAIGERVLRPALVGVSSGPPKTGAA